MSAKATATFDANDSPIQAAFRRVDKQLLGLEKKFAVVAKAAAMAFAVPAAAAGGLALGVKSALDTAGGLKDLSARTGVAAGDLAVLQQAFKNAGKDAEDVGPSINKMQKALATGAGNETIAKLGLNLEELKKKTPVDQFYAIGAAINRVNDPAQKAAAAMDLFGKSGGSLLSVFADGGLGEAASQVGAQAAILSKDAVLFDDVSDKLALAGLKTQGFFMGVADQVVPVLKPILDSMANMDFSKLGQQLGSVVALVVEAFADGKIGDIFCASLKIAMMNAGNFLVDVLKGDGMVIAQILEEAFKNACMTFEILTEPNFWKGMGSVLMGLAKSFIATMLDGVALILDKLAKVPFLKDKIGGAAEAVRNQAKDYRSGASESRNSAADLLAPIGGKVMDRMGDALKNIGASQAFAISQFGTSKLFDTSKDQSGLDQLWAGISSKVQMVSEKALADAKGAPSGLPGIDLDMGAKVGVNFLQRIGGGGGFGGGGDPLLAENQQQTGVLRDIKQILSFKQSPGGGFVPVFG